MRNKRYMKVGGYYSCLACKKHRNTLRSIKKHWKQSHTERKIRHADTE